MSERFSESLHRKLGPVWQAQQEHRFVRCLGDGSLTPGRFQIWLQQSYLFLIDYTRVFSLGAARADGETMKWMIAMAHGVYHQEMLLHQGYAIEFGLAREELPCGKKLPTTRAYTDHLLRVAALGSMVELVAALLPHLWGHAEIGQRLASQFGGENRYARWIDVYSGPVAEVRARQGRDLLDRLAEGAGTTVLICAEDAFASSSRYEWMFWQMCNEGEAWPI